MSNRAVLLHGFTQTSASWGTVRAGLEAAAIEVVAPDLPGHGTRAAVDVDLWGAAEAIVTDGGEASYVGYSMGGRVALHAALLRPDLVGSLVFVGATAGIEDDNDRGARVVADNALAASIEADGVEAFLDRWLSNPLFATLTPERAGRQQRSTDGAGLASSLRRAGTGAMTPLWDRLAEITCPVLCVVGERDEKFRALAERLVAGMAGPAAVTVIADAGHACHLEQPEAFISTVVPFLQDSHSPRA